MDSSSQVDVISLDFARAFDVVPIERLLLKMNYYGIRKLLPWFRDFLKNRKQRVVIEGTKSKLVEVLSGIAQGTRVAALCFLLFINDLPNSIINSFVDQVHKWTEVWGMSFNVLKCFVMSVTNNRNPAVHSYHLNGNTLVRTDSIKY